MKKIYTFENVEKVKRKNIQIAEDFKYGSKVIELLEKATTIDEINLVMASARQGEYE
jgi:hypothetical protein